MLNFRYDLEIIKIQFFSEDQIINYGILGFIAGLLDYLLFGPLFFRHIQIITSTNFTTPTQITTPTPVTTTMVPEGSGSPAEDGGNVFF